MKEHKPATEPSVTENLEELMLLQKRVRLAGKKHKDRRGHHHYHHHKSKRDKEKRRENSCDREMAEFEEFYKFQNDLD